MPVESPEERLVEEDYGSGLTPREREITALVATGASNKEIAYLLAISEKTVKNTLTKVFSKTGTRCRTELAVQSILAQQHASRL